MTVAEFLVRALIAYALLGAGFGIAFVSAGVQRIDTQAQGAGLGFRMLIFPGVAALWPLLLMRWLRGPAQPPEERNPHRDAALPEDSR